MSEIFVIVEHRLNEIRDITFEMLFKACELAQTHSHTVTAILLGHEVSSMAEQISDRADKVLLFDDGHRREIRRKLSHACTNVCLCSRHRIHLPGEKGRFRPCCLCRWGS